MSRGKSASLPLFCRGDVNAFWALFADNLANMIIVAVVLTRFYGISGDVVYGHVLPGLGMALIAGLGFYAWQARKLARGRPADKGGSSIENFQAAQSKAEALTKGLGLTAVWPTFLLVRRRRFAC